jgi:hypothetical protein
MVELATDGGGAPGLLDPQAGTERPGCSRDWINEERAPMLSASRECKVFIAIVWTNR